MNNCSHIHADGLTLICAMRYALGRSTYVVPAVVEVLMREWDKLSHKNQFVIHRDIKELLDKGGGGMECDKAQWRKVLELKMKLPEMDTRIRKIHYP